MVYVMKADVRRGPLHDGVHLHKAGRLKRSVIVTPFNVVLESNPGEVVLGIEEVGAQGKGEGKRNDARQEEALPAQEIIKGHQEAGMETEGDHGIVMALF